jgi:hypothetical protein
MLTELTLKYLVLEEETRWLAAGEMNSTSVMRMLFAVAHAKRPDNFNHAIKGYLLLVSGLGKRYGYNNSPLLWNTNVTAKRVFLSSSIFSHQSRTILKNRRLGEDSLTSWISIAALAERRRLELVTGLSLTVYFKITRV